MPSILIVDPDEGLVQALQMVFAEVGLQALVAETDWQAYEIIAHHTPDLILIADGRPHINIREFCRTLKAEPSLAAIPLIMQSGNLRVQNPDYARAIGVDAVLPKPYSSTMLLAIIDRFLGLNHPDASPI